MINYKKYLNKEVKVKIDRQLGSLHPTYNYIYTVNYGFIPNTVAEDGEEIDVYLLGVFEPVEKYEGVCRAIVYRKDDEENKLIVTPKNKDYSKEQIKALVEFQERFFEINIIK